MLIAIAIEKYCTVLSIIIGLEDYKCKKKIHFKEPHKFLVPYQLDIPGSHFSRRLNSFSKHLGPQKVVMLYVQQPLTLCQKTRAETAQTMAYSDS